MTNIRKLAIQLHQTGNGKQILKAMDSLFEISLNQGDDVREVVSLSGGQISVNEETVLHKKVS